MKKKTALINGINGKDGAYLAEFLINKNYIVHGMKRRTSLINTQRVDHLYQEKNKKNSNFILHHGDMTDSPSIYNLIKKIKPNEIYNFADQDHVRWSTELPVYSFDVTGSSTIKIL